MATVNSVRGVCPHDRPDTCGVLTEMSDGRNINWTTPVTLDEFAGQRTDHTNRVWVSRV